jgi:S-adenosylmethionine synthetase
MKRYSEAVLNGHPDKFCDLVADGLLGEINKSDPDAHAQIEVSVWSDVIFITGSVVTKEPVAFSITDVICDIGKRIGYTHENHIDVTRYQILDHICWLTDNPLRWTNYSNDQSIVVGYAGYDTLTHFLPPEHFLAWYFREALINSMDSGTLKTHGPDGKILVVMNEEYSGWMLNLVLVTMQQNESASFISFTGLIEKVLFEAYQQIKKQDFRWCTPWKEIKVLINPNGPLLNGGSDGDNGQTGRKLVMDFYGPRIPIGGGAIYGKDLAHIDRLGATMARRFALDMVMNGSKEALVKVCFAPGIDEPLSIDIVSDKRPLVNPDEYFRFSTMKKMINPNDIFYNLNELGTFYNSGLSFNRVAVISK